MVYYKDISKDAGLADSEDSIQAHKGEYNGLEVYLKGNTPILGSRLCQDTRGGIKRECWEKETPSFQLE